MVYRAGFKTLISQIYSPDDERIDSDVQFGVTRALIGNYIRHDEPSPELGFVAPWYSLDQRFTLEAGEARRPVAPIRAKVAAAAHEG
jgi:catechol 1,2-dioxygenase